MIRRIRAFFSDFQFRDPKDVFFNQTRSFYLAFLIVRFFYAMQFFYLDKLYAQWLRWRNKEVLDLIWPLFWKDLIGTARTVDIIIVLYTLGLGLAVLFTGNRWYRFIAFLGLLLCAAFDNSFGKINHGWHASVMIAFVFLFLPDGNQDHLFSRRILRQKFLSVFITAQASLLMIYSLAGFWKILTAIDQALRGQMHAFSMNGFAYLVADRLVTTETEALLAFDIISRPWLARFLMFIAIYFEFFALWILARPSLHFFFGLGLIAVHLGSVLTLSIQFSNNILLIALFLLCSPFAFTKITFKQRIMALPPLDLLFRLWYVMTKRKNIQPH